MVLLSLAKASEESERQSKVAAMPLPTPRKLTPTKSDKLADLIAACAIAPPGSRSESDFAVCCYAIREGVAADEVWSRIQSVGKFAERGRSYFDLTWENAAYDVRVSKFEKIQRRTAAPVTPEAIAAPPESSSAPYTEPMETAVRPVIFVDPKSTLVAETMSEITEHLVRTVSPGASNRVFRTFDEAGASELSELEMSLGLSTVQASLASETLRFSLTTTTRPTSGK